jgi:allantoinase
MSVIKDHPSTVLAFHAELDTPEGPLPDVSSHNQTHYFTFLTSRPQHLEVNAISLITQLQTHFPSLRCHIVHLSAASALPIIRKAKADGAKLTVETCFHYLCLSSDEIPDGKPEFKCCPPIREKANRGLLWEALKDGTIDFVVSDHSPCVADLKKLDEGDIMSAWGGISALGLGLSLLWTESQKDQKEVGLSQIVKWTSTAAAKHAGLDATKGAIKAGADADIVFWDPKAEFQVRVTKRWLLSLPALAYADALASVQFQVTRESLQFKNKLSPYQGFTLKGQVQQVYLRGKLAYNKGKGFNGFIPLGKLL